MKGEFNMSSTNKTTNYKLSQFVGSDVPSYLGDYNGDMSKIDKAIGDVANSQGSVEQSVVGLTADVQGLSTQVSGVSTSLQQLQTSVAQIDSGYKQADTALSQRITANANNIQTNTTAIEGINTTIGTEDISGIGDGTIKGAISNVNSSLGWKLLDTKVGKEAINLNANYNELFVLVRYGEQYNNYTYYLLKDFLGDLLVDFNNGFYRNNNNHITITISASLSSIKLAYVGDDTNDYTNESTIKVYYR